MKRSIVRIEVELRGELIDYELKIQRVQRALEREFPWATGSDIDVLSIVMVQPDPDAVPHDRGLCDCTECENWRAAESSHAGEVETDDDPGAGNPLP